MPERLSVVSRRLSEPAAARIAVSVLFAVNGALYATVIPRLPAIKADLGLSNAAFGAALAGTPAGALVAGLLAGRLTSRLGSGRLAVLTGALYGAVLVLPGIADRWILLAAALLLFGAFDAVMDVAQNSHGLRVQRVYGRSIINGLHAWWSIGAVTGAAVGTLAATAGVPVPLHLALAGVVLAGVTLLSGRWLLPGPDHPPGLVGPADGHFGADPGVGPDVRRDAGPRVRPGGPGLRVTARALGLVGLFTLLVAVAEDVPSSWSAVYARQEVEVPAGVAGLAYVAFAAAMTVGRFGNDWLVERFGEVAVTRAGAASAAAGVGLAAVSGTMPVVLLGFTVAGLGVSSLFPALFHAAGTRPGIPTAQGVAFVAWVSRVGFLFAPLIVGIVADAAGLSRGLLVGVLAATLAAALAGVLRPPRRPPLIPHDARHDASETLAGNPARGVGPPR